jgi:hypothetical protein
MLASSIDKNRRAFRHSSRRSFHTSILPNAISHLADPELPIDIGYRRAALGLPERMPLVEHLQCPLPHDGFAAPPNHRGGSQLNSSISFSGT